MNRQAGGRPAKSGARREVKSFRLVPDAIARLERLRSDRGGSTSDVLNELLLTGRAEPAEPARAPRFEVLPGQADVDAPKLAPLARFRVLSGRTADTVDDESNRMGLELERLRDGLGAVLGEIEGLMAEQLGESAEGPARKGARAMDPYGQGFRDGMLEALETAYALLQAELLISEGFAIT